MNHFHKTAFQPTFSCCAILEVRVLPNHNHTHNSDCKCTRPQEAIRKSHHLYACLRIQAPHGRVLFKRRAAAVEGDALDALLLNLPFFVYTHSPRRNTRVPYLPLPIVHTQTK